MEHGPSGVLVESDTETLADGCDALVVVTEWHRHLDYAKLGDQIGR